MGVAPLLLQLQLL